MRGDGQGFILVMESLDTRRENLSNLERECQTSRL